MHQLMIILILWGRAGDERSSGNVKHGVLGSGPEPPEVSSGCGRPITLPVLCLLGQVQPWRRPPESPVQATP